MRPPAGFIEQYRGAGGTARLFAHSGADVEQLSKRLGEEHLQGIAILQVTPSPYQIRSRLGKELTDARSGSRLVELSIVTADGKIRQ